MAIAGTPASTVKGCVRRRGHLRGSVSISRRQALTDHLQARGIGTGLDAVVERLEGNALSHQLAWHARGR